MKEQEQMPDGVIRHQNVNHQNIRHQINIGVGLLVVIASAIGRAYLAQGPQARAAVMASLAPESGAGRRAATSLPGSGPKTPRSSSGPKPSSLTAVVETIVRRPTASPRAQKRMVRELALMKQGIDPPRFKIPQKEGIRDDMEWALPDRKYWQTIPIPARTIPQDWSRLPMVRFRNTEIDGIRQIYLHRASGFDQWLLSDPDHDVKACISFERATRRIYFMELARRSDGRWRLRMAKDNCYSCHPSGLRVIRPFDDRRVDRATLARFNRLILSYGPCQFGSIVNRALRGKPFLDARCVSCHNGTLRGRLYQIHAQTSYFKVHDERTMPPGRIS